MGSCKETIWTFFWGIVFFWEKMTFGEQFRRTFKGCFGEGMMGSFGGWFWRTGIWGRQCGMHFRPFGGQLWHFRGSQG